jgi:hypothetical protein
LREGRGRAKSLGDGRTDRLVELEYDRFLGKFNVKVDYYYFDLKTF